MGSDTTDGLDPCVTFFKGIGQPKRSKLYFQTNGQEMENKSEEKKQIAL